MRAEGRKGLGVARGLGRVAPCVHTCATPKGMEPAFCSRQNLKLRKMPWAVSGRRYPVRLPTGPMGVGNMRLNATGSVRSFLVTGDLIYWASG